MVIGRLLVFLPARNGCYSVKKGYALLKNEGRQGDSRPGDIWKIVWRKGHVLPRIRLFLWKLLNNALPLGKVLATRMCSRDPTCATCGCGDEDVTHMLFHCLFSRACWYMNGYPLRSDQLGDNLEQALTLISTQASSEQWEEVANTMWAIWRRRNYQAYNGKRPTFSGFQSYLQAIRMETMFSSAGKPVRALTPPQEKPQFREITCLSDGSWLSEWNSGLGFILKRDHQLIAYRSAKVTACSPLQAEAQALMEAMRYTIEVRILACSFCTDSQLLAKICTNAQPPTEVDWRAYDEIFQVWRMLKENRNFDCHYVPRSQVGMADYLAKKRQGMGLGWDYTGFTYPILRTIMFRFWLHVL